MRHIKPHALHFYRLYMFSSFRNFRPPAVPETMLNDVFKQSTTFALCGFFQGDPFDRQGNCRLQISGDAIASSYLVALTRLFPEAKLQGKVHQAAKESANAKAYEMETLCITILAEHLRDLFYTDEDVQFDAYGKEWKQLQTLDFWQLAIMQEVSQVRRHIEKHQKNESTT